MNPTQNAAARSESVQQASPARQLRPVNGQRNALAGREPQVDRLAVLTSQVQRNPLANANRSNELCMQDFI